MSEFIDCGLKLKLHTNQWKTLGTGLFFGESFLTDKPNIEYFLLPIEGARLLLHVVFTFAADFIGIGRVGHRACSTVVFVIGPRTPDMNPNQDALLRINFLYQAAHCMLLQNPENTALARFYITTMKNVAKKAVVRIHPNIKRTVCKRCDLLLIPGLTSKVRLRAKRQKHAVVTCLECGQVKRFLSNNNYKLWVERPECTQNPETAKETG